ncbi:protein of unknown function [Cupriavidus taiwanensis]|nr:protein of unknown function [Cupriavidus taiwanensis]
MDAHHVRHRGQVGDGGEVLGGIVGQSRVDRRIDAVGRGRGDAQRIAVRRGLGQEGGADAAAGTAAVVDHHGLAQLLAELVGDDARDDVGGAACGERHHQRDRLGGVAGLGGGAERQAGGEGGRGGGQDAEQVATLHDLCGERYQGRDKGVFTILLVQAEPSQTK